MKQVSKLGTAIAICSLAVLFSIVPIFKPGNLVLAQEDLGLDLLSEQVNYGPQLSEISSDNVVFGPEWPVEKEDVPLGPQLPPEKPDLSVPVLSMAKSLLGLPYQFGGSNPKQAMDCSSYVQLVFKQAGLELPRVTYDQFKQGNPVELDQLKPGDLLFFSTNGPGPSHIGIYAGNGEFIHESPPGVQITRLDTPGYLKHFIGARRVLD